MGFGWKDPSPVSVALPPSTPSSAMNAASGDSRNGMYGLVGADSSKPRMKQEGFNVSQTALDNSRIAENYFNNVFSMSQQGQDSNGDQLSNSAFDFNTFNLQQALAEQLQSITASSNQRGQQQGRDISNNANQSLNDSSGNMAMSPEDALTAFVANNITQQDLMAGQISSNELEGHNGNNEGQNGISYNRDLDIHPSDGQQGGNIDYLSPEYWAALEQNTQYQIANPASNVDFKNAHAYQQGTGIFGPQNSGDQSDMSIQDAQRLFRQLQAGLKSAQQGQSGWSGNNSQQFANFADQQQDQPRGRSPNMSSARAIPTQQTLAQCLLPSFSPLDKGVGNFDFDFSRLNMAGGRMANPINDSKLASASATATAAVMNMDMDFANPSGMNGINPSMVDPSGASMNGYNNNIMGSVFGQSRDQQGVFARGRRFDQSGETPRTSVSMLSTRSPSTGSGRDVDMQGSQTPAETGMKSGGVDPAQLQRPRSPSASRAGRRSSSNTRTRHGASDGIGPARRPSFNSHTVARTAAMQGSYPNPHHPAVVAPVTVASRPSHKRSSSSSNQVHTLASGNNSHGIEKDAEWRQLAGMGPIPVTSPKSAHVPSFNASEAGLSNSPISNGSPASTVLKSPPAAKARRLSGTETTSTRPSARRKASTSRNRRGSRSSIAVKKEDLFDTGDASLMDADDNALSDGDHEENIELTPEELSKMTDAQIATEKRRRAHNLVERHRREAINKGFVELEALLSSSDTARRLIQEAKIRDGVDDEDDMPTSGKKSKKSKKNNKKTSGGGMCKETILQSALALLQEQRRMIDEQRSIISTLRSQAAPAALANGSSIIPDSVFTQLNANYAALGIPGGDDSLRTVEDVMSGGLQPVMPTAVDPLLNRGRRLSSNSDIRARSRSAIRSMKAIQESPGEGHQG
ncbi:hypothetical protein NliqN6_0435 [Naganishia liquefaciens]|uniref:BHLH domain-containing protein n=1 Tax=Naganishia liquefaciens TaxID=104408 RepID=A0A8H3TNI2_9TREE|nr:hypothetical protein NliqN6_0435 [Naganishia liquefaciens]